MLLPRRIAWRRGLVARILHQCGLAGSKPQRCHHGTRHPGISFWRYDRMPQITTQAKRHGGLVTQHPIDPVGSRPPNGGGFGQRRIFPVVQSAPPRTPDGRLPPLTVSGPGGIPGSLSQRRCPRRPAGDLLLGAAAMIGRAPATGPADPLENPTTGIPDACRDTDTSPAVQTPPGNCRAGGRNDPLLQRPVVRGSVPGAATHSPP